MNIEKTLKTPKPTFAAIHRFYYECQQISLFLPVIRSYESFLMWLVAVTWPHYERRVERALGKCGYDVYLPKCKTPKKRTALLFPRYVFAGPAEQWRELREVYGVSRLLRAGDQPAMVEEKTLEALKAREDANGFVKLPQHHVARLRVGQRVRITIGMFAGQKGVYKGTSKRWERVDLPALGTVQLPPGNLMAE